MCDTVKEVGGLGWDYTTECCMCDTVKEVGGLLAGLYN